MTHEEEIELGKELAQYAADPLKFVLECFPWDSHPELKGAAPEKWQREVLEAIRDGLPEEKVAGGQLPTNLFLLICTPLLRSSRRAPKRFPLHTGYYAAREKTLRTTMERATKIDGPHEPSVGICMD